MGISLNDYRRRWLFVLARLATVGIYLAASMPKFFNVGLFKATILAYYGFLPEMLAVAMAIIVPWVEFGLALLLLLEEKKTCIPAALLALLSLYYVVNSIIFLNHWMPYGCGCFGFGEAEVLGISGVLRNILIMAVSALAYIGARNGKARLRR